MRCPSCGYLESKVVDSRPSEDGTSIRRRRECLKCQRRFTTYERLGDNPLVIVKVDGSSEAYDRNKLFRGLLIACAKRPISKEQVDDLIDSIETELRNTSRTEIRSKELGEMALKRLMSGSRAYTKTFKTLKNSLKHLRSCDKSCQNSYSFL